MSDVNPAVYMTFIEGKTGPTLGDIADLPWFFWLFMIAFCFGIGSWMTIDNLQRQKDQDNWEKCLHQTYPQTFSDVYGATGLNCKAIMDE